eukprot:TRINITY_DN58847_c0_g1_i1.p1 TRINITY_DN58847_c0_g1~~TRINITY_DN58847_c0_g1_i1.p1  ORF type:complete len:1439 (+),score=298.77 TRINITY_DN58847_c0_g1_i1:5415-9731(+)
MTAVWPCARLGTRTSRHWPQRRRKSARKKKSSRRNLSKSEKLPRRPKKAGKAPAPDEADKEPPAQPETTKPSEEEEAKTTAETDFCKKPSVGTWLSPSLPEKDGDDESKPQEEDGKKDAKKKDEEEEEEKPPYDSWWPPFGVQEASEVHKGAPSQTMVCHAKKVKPGQWNLLTLVVQCASAAAPEARFVTAYLNCEVAFHVQAHPALEEALAIDATAGLCIFPAATGPASAPPGGQLRAMELCTRAFCMEEVYEAQVPRGVWKCTKCSGYNPPGKRLDKLMCTCGALRPQSAPRPKDDKDDEHPGLTVVVADSFQQLVIDSDKHVFLDVYADWCGPCIEAKPHFYKLAALLRACDDISICSMDADLNEKQTTYIPESHIPVFKLFVRGDKQNPIGYKGERTLKGFLAFLKQHANVDVNDALRLLYGDYCSQHGIENLLRRFLACLLASSIPDSGETVPELPPNLMRWSQQYFIDPDRFTPSDLNATTLLASSPAEEQSEGAAIRAAAADVPSSLLPAALRPLPEGTKVRVTSNEATLERTQRLLPGGVARKEFLGKVGTVHQVEGSEITVKFPPEYFCITKADRPRGFFQRMQAELEKQGLLKLHRQALEIDGTQPTLGSAPHRKTRWAEAWDAMSDANRNRLRAFVQHIDDVLVSAQPEDPMQYLIHAMSDSHPITTSTVYPHFQSEKHPDKVMVKAPKPLGKQEANSAWSELESSLFLPDAFGVRGYQGDDSRVALLRQLISRGLPPDFLFRGRPMLHRACESGDLPLAELLFACGANLHARGGDEMSLPIEVAAWCGQSVLVRFVLANGSCYGQALHFASLAGEVEIVKLLLEYGCPPHIRWAGFSPLDLAVAACKEQVVHMLLRSPQLLQARAGAGETLSSQVLARFGLGSRSRRIHMAAKLGGPRGGSMIAELLKQGGAVRGSTSSGEWWAALENEEGRTALDVAALPVRLQLRPRCIEVWSVLLASWPLPENEAGLTALRSVLEANGDPNCAGAAGWTPLCLCAMADRGDACQLLLDFGADPFAPGPRGRTAMLWADWYQASSALAVLKADGRREKRDDREGLKRLQAATKDEASALVTPLTPEALGRAVNFASRDFRGICKASLWARMEECWEPAVAPTAPAAGSISRLWLTGEEAAESPADSNELDEVLNKAEVEGSLVDFASMSDIVAAAKLLVQTKIASGSAGDAALGAFALFVLNLLSGAARRDLNMSFSMPEDKSLWTHALLRVAGHAWRSLPAERSVVFRSVRLEGHDFSAYREHLERFAPRRPVSWTCLTYGTLDRRVATASLDDWEGAAVVFKMYCLTARRVNEYSWLAGEDCNPMLHESLVAPGTQFVSRGVFEMSDTTMRQNVPMDSQLQGDEFSIREEIEPIPLAPADAPLRRRLLVVLEEVLPPEILRSAIESSAQSSGGTASRAPPKTTAGGLRFAKH